MNTARIRQLIALSASPFEEEARTSAFLACKALREDGRFLIGQEVDEARAEAAALKERLRTVETARPRKKKRAEPDPAKPDPNRGCWFKSNYNNSCKFCCSKYSIGDRVYWVRGLGSFCSSKCAREFLQ
jgi:hypothetical protein